MGFHRTPTRHVHMCSQNFGQQNHSTTSLFRSCSSIPVIRSQQHWYESTGLGCHPNTVPWTRRTSRHELSWVHMKHPIIHLDWPLKLEHHRLSLPRMVYWTSLRWCVRYVSYSPCILLFSSRLCVTSVSTESNVEQVFSPLWHGFDNDQQPCVQTLSQRYHGQVLWDVPWQELGKQKRLFYNVTVCLVEIYWGHGWDHGCVFIRGSKERSQSGYMELQNMFS